MNITPQFDPSVNSAPSWYVDAVNFTIQLFNDQFTNNITVPINFGWGERNGQAILSPDIAASEANFSLLDYLTLKSGFAQGSQNSQLGAASMPADDPTGGGAFRVSMALQKALGLIDGNAPDGFGTDGWVGLRSDVNWNPDFQSPPGDGQFDAVGELEHEISEVLGRIGVLGRTTSSDGRSVYGPMDLYRWDFATDQRTFSPDTGRESSMAFERRRSAAISPIGDRTRPATPSGMLSPECGQPSRGAISRSCERWATSRRPRVRSSMVEGLHPVATG